MVTLMVSPVIRVPFASHICIYPTISKWCVLLSPRCHNFGWKINHLNHLNHLNKLDEKFIERNATSLDSNRTWIKRISPEFLFIFWIINFFFWLYFISFHAIRIWFGFWPTGTLDSQSSNDESRPSTHPDEYSQQQQSPPKRFVNVEKYLDESSSDSGSPLKTLHDIRYVDPILSLFRSIFTIVRPYENYRFYVKCRDRHRPLLRKQKK